jgi:hypothetical protein
MCVIGAKYLKNLGWVGFKNRDRNYFATTKIKSEFIGLEKLLIWDSITRYSEGINENGISILSSCLSVKDDEDEITIARNKLIEKGEYQSPIGLAIRFALSLPTLELAIQSLIDNQTTGHILIFNQDILYILEGAFHFDLNGNKTENYEYILKRIDPREAYLVRSNHGISLPYAGYQYNEINWDSRVSSEKRLNQVKKKLKTANSDNEIIEAFSCTLNKNVQLNPLRIDFNEKNLKTTGQIMILPKKRELRYRPVLGEMIIDHSTKKANKNIFKPMEKIIKPI